MAYDPAKDPFMNRGLQTGALLFKAFRESVKETHKNCEGCGEKNVTIASRDDFCADCYCHMCEGWGWIMRGPPWPEFSPCIECDNKNDLPSP